ncbi:MAG: hypothetical protein ACI90V_012859 [Bacillariaceae sp.]|jgi:hypothetical protein
MYRCQCWIENLFLFLFVLPFNKCIVDSLTQYNVFYSRTNHLDAESIQWLETYLDKFQGTVVCITHDRYFLNNCAGWILELGKIRLIRHL